VPRNGQYARPVAHDYVLALPQDDISSFLERPYRIKMIDPRKLGQSGLRFDFHDANVLIADLIVHDRQVFGDGRTNIVQRVGLGAPLGPAPR